MPQNWKIYKLSEIAESISRGISPKYTEGEGTVVINQRCIRDNKILYENARKHDHKLKSISENKILKKYDVLINSTGVGTLGRVSQFKNFNENTTVDSHVTIFRPKMEFADEFLGYAMVNMENRIEALAEGSTGQTELSRTRLGEEIEISIPDSQGEREAIASILSALDDKIELNLQQNKTLEEMAMALYKHWFLDFGPFKEGKFIDSELGRIPEGWEVGKLRNNIDLNPTLKLSKGTIAPFIEMKVLPIDSSSISEVAYKSFSGGAKFQNGDTLFARITPCLENGKTAFVDLLNENETAFGSTEFLVMRAKKGISKFWVYLIARDSNLRKHAISSMVGTSGRQRVQNEPFLDFEIALAPLQIHSNFNKITTQWFEQIKANTLENNSLNDLRDSLLPKLISGEIKINYSNDRN